MRELILVASLLLSGCSGTAAEDTSSVDEDFSDFHVIDWQKPALEANKAIEHGDLALWIEARRGVAVLGLTDIAPERIESHCGLKYLPDSGDVYRPEDAEQRQQKRQFAIEYNQRVIPHCLDKLQQ